jgi:hypothetical protein
MAGIESATTVITILLAELVLVGFTGYKHFTSLYSLFANACFIF